MRRPLFLCVGGAIALSVIPLGAVQISSMAAYGDLAVHRSLPAYFHASVLSRVPAFGNLLAQAAALVHNGDVERASALLAILPDDTESEDLRGRVAASAGKTEDSIVHFTRARDGARAQQMIDTLDPTSDRSLEPIERSARLLRLLDYQRRLVAVLVTDAQALDTEGQAWLRLGQLQRAAADTVPMQRRSLYGAAEQSYGRALASAPNDATFLLGAANQSLLSAVAFNTDLSSAERWFLRAIEVVPNRAPGYAGMALAAAIRADCVAARRWHERWRAMRAGEDHDPVDDPELGQPLRLCL